MEATSASAPPAQEPEVSVVMPVYNGAAFVPDAIASILAQQDVRFELLVIDDGSRDGSEAVIRQSLGDDPRGRVVRNPTNRGLAQTLNIGLQDTRGPFVLILHQDCRLIGRRWLADALEQLRRSSAPGIAGWPVHSVSKMSRVERIYWVIRAHTFASAPTAATACRPSAYSENKCDLFRRAALDAVGGFAGELRHGGEDQVLATALRQRGSAIVHSRDLPYSLSLGNVQGVASNLRKEWFYGRGARDIVRKVGVKPLRDGTAGPGMDPWKVNRISGVVWPPISLLGLVLLVVYGASSPWFWVLFALLTIPILARVLQLRVRAARHSSSYELSSLDQAGVALLGPVSDLAFVLGMLTP